LNVGVVGFSGDSKEVLVIAEVPPHSSCQNMGEVLGFCIALQAKEVVARLPEKAARRAWTGLLGPRLAVAKSPSASTSSLPGVSAIYSENFNSP
jgi:hypothetical protein